MTKVYNCEGTFVTARVPGLLRKELCWNTNRFSRIPEPDSRLTGCYASQPEAKPIIPVNQLGLHVNNTRKFPHNPGLYLTVKLEMEETIDTLRNVHFTWPVLRGEGCNQRTHGAKITPLLRRIDVATSLLHNNDATIKSWSMWIRYICGPVTVDSFLKNMSTRICFKRRKQNQFLYYSQQRYPDLVSWQDLWYLIWAIKLFSHCWLPAACVVGWYPKCRVVTNYD